MANEAELVRALNRITAELHETNKLSKQANDMSKQAIANAKHQMDVQNVIYAITLGALNQEEINQISEALRKHVENITSGL